MPYSKRGLGVRLIYLVISLIVWIFTIGGRLFWNRNGILCYHGITDDQKETFQVQLRSISNRIININENSSPPLLCAKPRVVLTFDDAFVNLQTNVIPFTKFLALPISIFVPTGSIGKKPSWLSGTRHPDKHENVMNECQIKELGRNDLITIGNHTVSHRRLNNLLPKKVYEEIELAQNTLGVLIGKKINALAFPHGDHNQQVCDIASSLGLSRLYTLNPVMCHWNQTSGEFGRFSVSPDMWPIEFRLTIDGAYCWLSPLGKSSRSFVVMRGAIKYECFCIEVETF